MELIYEKDNQRAALYDAGKLIGECDYELEDDHWVITHTFVEKAYGGQGLARKLVNTLIEEARKEQIRIKPVCSYAVKVLSDQIYDDVRLQGFLQSFHYIVKKILRLCKIYVIMFHTKLCFKI